jgi:putative ABC transport system permease protein
MVLNYFNYAIRLLIRNPLTTLIHVTGLTVGFGAFLMLWPYAEYELRSDQYHSDANRIARLAGELKWTDDDQVWKSLLSAFNNWGVAHEVATTFPNVEAVTRIVAQINFNERVHGLNNYLAISTYDRSGNKNTYRETRAVLADPNLFQFFSIPLLEGNAQNVLETSNSVVISETLKKRYFGDGIAVGNTLYANDSIMLQVTGVFQDIPHNSHLRFDMAISAAGKKGTDVPVWGGWDGYCYLTKE